MRKLGRCNRRMMRAALVVAGALVLPGAPALANDLDFKHELARIDQALRDNPSRVPALAVKSCRSRRKAAIRYQKAARHAEAERALEYCIQVLQIPESES